MRRTKIVATLGPASRSPECIAALLDAGVDVTRINASHGDHATHRETIRRVRDIARARGHTVGVLLDLQGPKIRVGELAAPAAVKAGETFTFAVGRAPRSGELAADYPLLDRDVVTGHTLLIDDGQIASEVIEVEPGRVRCRAQNDGIIHARKGINLPGSVVSAPAITEKDRADIRFAVEAEVDAIALSFVRRPQDVEELKTLLAEHGRAIPIIAKIEKPQALDRLEAILTASWGVMVARGDLGVELPPEDVPMAQKRIIHAANHLGRPVITATQMLDSMTRNPRPTRAEASDVANAVLDGTDAVMLSNETASGAYPVESVTMMARILDATEAYARPRPQGRRRERGVETIPEGVADAACTVAENLGAKAVVAFSRTGGTAILVSQRRTTVPILAFTPSERVQALLSLVWGVRTRLLPDAASIDETMRGLDEALLSLGMATRGDAVVVAMGAPSAPEGHTNIMMVHHVGATAFG